MLTVIAYIGILVMLGGAALAIRPSERFRVATRKRAAAVIGAGTVIAAIALGLPASESSPNVLRTRLDEFVPAWQFREYHTIKIAASPERVFDAIHRVRADEIFLFNTLTWIRRAGRSTPEGVLNAGSADPIVEVAVRGGFARLADDAPRELVLGTVVIAPPGVEGEVTPDLFRRRLPPGFAVAAMNFLLTPVDDSSTFVSTETRVYANDQSSSHRFAAYWRLIHPGSSFLRRSWLRAVAKRATAPEIH